MNEEPQLKPRLGLFSATTIIVGSMIGSGIFFAPSIMAKWVQTPSILIGLWVLGGIFTICGALSLAEMAAMSPQAGGQYVCLREAFGSFWAFLFGWTLFLVIQTGFNAAVSIAFAKTLGVFVPFFAEKNVILSIPLGDGIAAFQDNKSIPAFLMHLNINTAQLLACGVIIILTAINIMGVRGGAFVQNLFTVLKVAALAALIAVGLIKGAGNTSHFQPLFEAIPGEEAAKVGLLAGLAVALSKALFAYDSWNSVTFVAEEVRNPQRTLPRALLFGSLLVMLIYVLTNVAFLLIIPIGDMAHIEENRAAHKVASMIFGNVGETLVIVAILVSTFGCVNGLILSGARVSYAMARENLFFKSCARLHPTCETPATALVYQGIWSCVLTLTGSYNDLLTYTTFASVLFGALTVAGIFRMRAMQPDRPRPYRCWGYPFTPALYLVIAVPFLIYVVVGDWVSSGIGLLLIFTGIPFYLAWRR